MLKIFPGRLALLPASVLVLGHNLNGQEIFTVGFGSSTQLVSQNDTWHFHKGTNAPTVGWQTNADATLDNTWAAGQGGFGYADNSPETAQVKTPLPDMLNRYTTVYIRRSFEVSNVPGATEELQ